MTQDRELLIEALDTLRALERMVTSIEPEDGQAELMAEANDILAQAAVTMHKIKQHLESVT